MQLTQMALSGSVLIVCIAAIRTVALQRLPKAAFLILWELAALRLLLPIAIPVPAGPLPLPALPSTPAVLVTGGGASPVPAPESASDLLLWLWALGTAAFALRFLWVYVKTRRVLDTGLPLHSQAGEDWLSAHPLRRPVQLRTSDRIGSPLTYGILRPVILLPKAMPQEALEPVLTHEWIHIRRFDALFKPLFAAALCLHWWNPLVWMLYVLSDRDMELSCDAAALRLLGGERRRDYALTLLDLEERRMARNPLCSYFSKHVMIERMEAIMKFKKTTSAALAAAVILTVGATAVFAAEKEAPTFDALNDTEAVIPYGTELDLSDFQCEKLEDGSLLYVPKGIDLEKAMGEVGSVTYSPTYTVSHQQDAATGNTVSLEDLPSEGVDGSAVEPMLSEITSVKHSDQKRFAPEVWAEILEKIEAGEIVWED